jgi:beta-xylosidase
MLFANNNGKVTFGSLLSQQTIYLRLAADLEGNHTLMQYSLDGKNFTQLGDSCVLNRKNYWKGVRPGLFSYNVKQDSGIALFDWFKYRYDGPVGRQ